MSTVNEQERITIGSVNGQEITFATPTTADVPELQKFYRSNATESYQELEQNLEFQQLSRTTSHNAQKKDFRKYSLTLNNAIS